MRRLIISVFTALLFITIGKAQNVGIGTSNPTEKLDVNGGIKIGNSMNAASGTIRWNALKNDFEGFNGLAWVSLTGGKSGWGNQIDYVHENEASNIVLQTAYNDDGTYFGNSMSISGNYLVAGAPHDHYSSTGPYTSGSVKLLERTSEGWKYRMHLGNPVEEGDNSFGFSVGIHGNYVIVGAPYANDGVTDRGRVHIFLYNPSTNNFTEQVRLHEDYGVAFNYFGESVAINDGYAAMSAPNSDVGGIDKAGRVYIYRRSGSNWLQHGMLLAQDGAMGDRFGTALSLSGNWLAVGARDADVNGIGNAGKVYMYRLNSSNAWEYAATINCPAPRNSKYFGKSISLENDKLVIGAPSGSDTGKVYIYTFSNGWNLQDSIISSDCKKMDGFGTSVHIKDDRIIAGAPLANIGGEQGKGKAYIFKYDGASWTQEVILAASSGKAGDNFGKCVALHESTAIVSAPLAEVYPHWTDNGRLYFFYK